MDDAKVEINLTRLKQVFDKSDLSQTDLANEVGVNKSTANRWLQGFLKPHQRYIKPICDALGCELADIVDMDLTRYFTKTRAKAFEMFDTDDKYALELVRMVTQTASVAEVFADASAGDANQTHAKLQDWRNPDLYSFESDNTLAVVNYADSLPLVVSGPTRCAKTLRILEMLMGLHFANKGFRSLILRANAVDLGETIRRDIRDVLLKFQLDDPLSPVKAEGLGGSRNFKSLKINEGAMVLGGMNRPGRVLGTSYNLIYASQVEQFTEEQFNMLMTRCAGDCPGWLDDAGNPRGLFIADANPDDADHWVKQYEADGRLRIINFTFDDNPLFCRKGERTPAGKKVITQLDASLSGIYHDRYFKGLWCSVEGKVFDIKDEHYLDASQINTNDYRWYRACDFGISAPSVCLWIGEHKETKSLYVHREFRKTGMDTIELASEIKKHTKEVCLNTIIDNDEDKQKIFKRNGIVSQMTIKNQHSIMDGIHLIQERLRRTTEGVEGGIYFNRSLRINSDPVLVRDKKPLSILDEFKTYVVDPETDKPEGSDHGIDALRYFILFYESMPAKVGFGSTTAKRKTRV